MQNFFAKVVAFFAANRKKIVTLLVGRGLWSSVSWAYDNLLYAAAVGWLGALVGGAIMTTGSLVICAAMLLYHRKKKVEWLGWDDAVEALKEHEQSFAEVFEAMTTTRSLAYFTLATTLCTQQRVLMLAIVLAILVLFKIFILAIRIRALEDTIAFVALSIFEDPFLTTAYLRHGQQDGLRTRDWAILFASVLLGNCYWILRTVVIVQFAKYLWHLFF